MHSRYHAGDRTAEYPASPCRCQQLESSIPHPFFQLQFNSCANAIALPRLFRRAAGTIPEDRHSAFDQEVGELFDI